MVTMNLQISETISTELRIFRVLPKLGSTNLEDYLRLNLEECECRFNHRNEDLYKLILHVLTKNYLRLYPNLVLNLKIFFKLRYFIEFFQNSVAYNILLIYQGLIFLVER